MLTKNIIKILYLQNNLGLEVTVIRAMSLEEYLLGSDIQLLPFKHAVLSTQVDLTYSNVSAHHKAQDASFSFGKVFQKKSL